jgi:hypothetical protein
LTEIYLCHACSYHATLRMETPGQAAKTQRAGRRLMCTVQGEAPLAEFGASLAIAGNDSTSTTVAVGAPAETGPDALQSSHAGAVRLLRLSRSFWAQACVGGRLLNISSLDILSTIRGETQSRFGRTVAVAGDWLVVGAPLASVPVAQRTGPYREVGALYRWPLHRLPSGDGVLAAHSSSWKVLGSVAHGRLGSSIEAIANLNASSAWLVSGLPLADGVADGNSSNVVEMGGAVSLFPLPSSAQLLADLV